MATRARTEKLYIHFSAMKLKACYSFKANRISNILRTLNILYRVDPPQVGAE